jgi:hypothetical protein
MSQKAISAAPHVLQFVLKIPPPDFVPSGFFPSHIPTHLSGMGMGFPHLGQGLEDDGFDGIISFL